MTTMTMSLSIRITKLKNRLSREIVAAKSSYASVLGYCYLNICFQQILVCCKTCQWGNCVYKVAAAAAAVDDDLVLHSSTAMILTTMER
ncbi:hypothetical protein FRACYDRAFT_269049 [Fragilariopsis cylindrus CCMP1102]|uniref:Uncharacterized protein n=1 Tax=Fragilariopsis cylindrus CCMP1102 TaxID=635003 RepID=A0A1E7FEJ3_9STRA|nr:hypothetical protein FRACYDRAFT_269049 [Fragilariopsis cylindrus CCMP1102]|eukprot:OEU16591.1 hypothetical protein FRACYDRAFT_269049 [Fragilariopsis cylindrus CCMP1102]